MTHQWNMHSFDKGIPHFCSTKPGWFHTPKGECCSIEIEEVDCQMCRKLMDQIKAEVDGLKSSESKE